jgi:hypothetical protein
MMIKSKPERDCSFWSDFPSHLAIGMADFSPGEERNLDNAVIIDSAMKQENENGTVEVSPAIPQLLKS